MQSYADDAGYEILIVKVEKISKKAYKIFYVSENRFCDGDKFPEIKKTAKFFYPNKKLILWHIKDVDGHFVTIHEYKNRKK